MTGQVFPKKLWCLIWNSNNGTAHSCTCCVLKWKCSCFCISESLLLFPLCVFFWPDGWQLHTQWQVDSRGHKDGGLFRVRQIRVRSHLHFFYLTHLFRSFVLQIRADNRNWKSPTGSHRSLRSDTGCCCRSVFWRSILGGRENKRLIHPFDLSHLIISSKQQRVRG